MRSAWHLSAPSAALFLIGILTFTGCSSSLEIEVRDAVTDSWVWGATITVQDRVRHAYYQADAGTRSYEFADLRRGTTDIIVSAPGYAEKRHTISLKAGANALPQPIYVQPQRIPELRNAVVFERISSERLEVEIRLLDRNNRLISNHPGVDLRLLVRFDHDDPQHEAAVRRMDWRWNEHPTAQSRYVGTLELGSTVDTAKLEGRRTYLLLFPEHESWSETLIDDIQRLLARGEREQLADALTESKSLEAYFYVDPSDVREE